MGFILENADFRFLNDIYNVDYSKLGKKKIEQEIRRISSEFNFRMFNMGHNFFKTDL